MKKIILPVFLTGLSLLVIYFENSKYFFGKFINSIKPCDNKMAIESSACFVVYDIWLELFMFAVLIASLIVILIRLFEKISYKKRKG